MSTYTPIASLTLSSPAGDSTTPITFSSIPQGYTDLIIVANGLVTSGASLYLRFNGDTGSNYSVTSFRGNGSAASSERTTSASAATWSVWRTTGIQYGIIQLQNYSNPTTDKIFLSRSFDRDPFVYVYVGAWRNKSPITTIQILGDATYATGTTFSLYGIATGQVGTKATGGIVTTDATYAYHTFTSSGFFIPNASLTADVLVVAGGGGGGTTAGGGGGAGGLRLLTSQTISAPTTVIVGSGGSGTARGTSYLSALPGTSSSVNSISVSGGGGGGNDAGNGATGGSGGGSGGSSIGTHLGAAGNFGGYSPSEGGDGGDSVSSSPPYAAAGGGGAGGNGGNAGSASVAGAGGAGTNTYNSNVFTSWLTATNTGVSGYLAGGGGGGTYDGGTAGTGGTGGGGSGSSSSSGTGTAGTMSSGSGGGGGRAGGGNGGSGLVIIRYTLA